MTKDEGYLDRIAWYDLTRGKVGAVMTAEVFNHACHMLEGLPMPGYDLKCSICRHNRGMDN